MGVSPLPTFVPHNATDVQELQLLHQIQSHALNNTNALFLYFFMFLPIPMSWKLGLYNFFSHLPLPHLSSGQTVFFVTLWPIVTVVLLGIVLFVVIKITKFIIPLVVKLATQAILPLNKGGKVEKTFLELTFPHDTSKSSYATEQLYMLLHTVASQVTLTQKLLGRKRLFSLEIASKKGEGIKYYMCVPSKNTNVIKRSLISYLPGIKILEVDDYLSENTTSKKGTVSGIVELSLSQDFTLPLQSQKVLTEHDPISYLTGHMTNLNKGELISFQVITTPVLSVFHKSTINRIKHIGYNINKGLPIADLVIPSPFQKITSVFPINLLWAGTKGFLWIIKNLSLFIISLPVLLMDTSGKTVPIFMTGAIPDLKLLSPQEKELQQEVKEKIDQHLFETSIRILVVAKSEEEFETRTSGLISSFGTMTGIHQSITQRNSLPFIGSFTRQFKDFKNRTLTTFSLSQNPILSTSEISDLYHFPYTFTTKTEDMAKTLSPDLPAPKSLKSGRELDVVFGKNTYGNSVTNIGLTDDERAKHMYLLGKTGSGKSTIIYHMAKHDIQKGRGLCVVDVHGDLAEDLLSTVPEKRFNDVIYFNPFDLKYPIGINLLELPDDLEGDDLELEKELVTESVVSVFRRIFSKEENVNAHRIEYILRNAIYTAFYVPDRTLFTVYDLLTDKDFRTKVVSGIDDDNLKSFWKNEFGQAGSYQVVKMIGGVTAKVGRFLFSPTAKRILEQPHSTINFDRILNEEKILICNLSEGKIGEDTAQVLGLTIIAKVHQAALRRIRTGLSPDKRKPFYLFVDEFQNFATTSFTRILSGGRKFGLRLTLAEQSTAQQQDRNVVNVILANTGTVICFATSSPQDEQMMGSQFKPYIISQDLVNLPKYKFYIKMSATNPEEPFSGITLPIDTKRDAEKIEKIIEASRNNYASIYVKPVKKTSIKKSKDNTKNEKKTGLPDD